MLRCRAGQGMTIIADTHVHIYPLYDASRALETLIRKLTAYVGGAASGVQLAACLTERHDCHFFRSACDSAVPLDGLLRVEAIDEGQALAAHQDNAGSCLILPGRQIITRERLEVLALTKDLNIADNQPIFDVIESVISGGGVPVLPWSPGKWMFGRSAVVADALRRFDPSKLCIGDTTLRPHGWREPRIMADARSAGYTVLAGSDPLPVHGEEDRMAEYVTRFENAPEESGVADALRAAMLDPASRCDALGRRGSVAQIAKRWIANKRAK